MKTCEEMTRVVLARAKEKKVRQNRVRRGILCAVAGLCVVALAALGGAEFWNFRTDTPPVIGSEGIYPADSLKPRITLLYSTTEGKAEESMIAGVQVPQAFIRVRDISGMSDEEVVRARNEESQYAKEFKEGAWRSGRLMFGSERTLISLVQVGGLYVIPENYEQVADYSVETTEFGSAAIHPNPVKITGTDEICTGIEVFWRISDSLRDKIDRNPSMDLTQIKDTVRVTVNFKDGSSEIVTIDMVIDDEGNIYAIYGDTKIEM